MPDPAGIHAAALRFAPLVADGLLTASDPIPRLLDAAVLAGYSGCLGGLQSRLTWTIADAASDLRLRRILAERTIRRDTFAAMDRLTAGAAILAAAQGANVQAGSPYPPETVRAIVNDAAASWLKQRRYRHG